MNHADLAVIVPVYNEKANIQPFLQSLAQALESIRYEVIFVDDDSPDLTADEVRSQALLYENVRIIQRINRRGLASACVEGMMSTGAPYVAVMDADMQHDESILPEMLRKLRDENLDIVIGSRRLVADAIFAPPDRRAWLTKAGMLLSRCVCKANLSDPMSGYFVMDRRFLMEVVRSLSATGFKIMLDILATSPRPVKIGEVSYEFRQRKHGASKLDMLVMVEYAELLLDKLLRGLVPARYVMFCCIGAAGFVFHLAIVHVLTLRVGWTFSHAQYAAAFLVMSINFFLNNLLTFRTQRLRGWRLIPGFAIFFAACSAGLYFNVTVAESILAMRVWWLWASMAGLVIGSVWNYGVTSVFVWNLSRSRRNRIQQPHA